MCVAGKNMPHPEEYHGGILGILIKEGQENVLKPEVVGILTTDEWSYLQAMHDAIAINNEDRIKMYCNILDLFSYEELVEFCKN